MANFLTDKIEVDGRSVPVAAVGAGVAVVGAVIVLLTRRGQTVPATVSATPAASGGGVSSTESVTPDRLAAELATFGSDLQAQQTAGLSGLSAQFNELLAAGQGETAAQIAGLQSTLSGQYGDLQSQVSGQVSDISNQLAAQQTAVQNLTGRVTAVENKAQKIDALTLAVRTVGSYLARVITIAPTLADSTTTQAANYRATNTNEVQAALQPIGGAIF